MVPDTISFFFPSSCLMAFLIESFLPVSYFAVEGSLEVTHPVTASKSMERTNAVTMGMGPPSS
jgi:hypothetical protein